MADIVTYTSVPGSRTVRTGPRVATVTVNGAKREWVNGVGGAQSGWANPTDSGTDTPTPSFNGAEKRRVDGSSSDEESTPASGSSDTPNTTTAQNPPLSSTASTSVHSAPPLDIHDGESTVEKEGVSHDEPIQEEGQRWHTPRGPSPTSPSTPITPLGASDILRGATDDRTSPEATASWFPNTTENAQEGRVFPKEISDVLLCIKESLETGFITPSQLESILAALDADATEGECLVDSMPTIEEEDAVVETVEADASTTTPDDVPHNDVGLSISTIPGCTACCSCSDSARSGNSASSIPLRATTDNTDASWQTIVAACLLKGEKVPGWSWATDVRFFDSNGPHVRTLFAGPGGALLICDLY